MNSDKVSGILAPTKCQGSFSEDVHAGESQSVLRTLSLLERYIPKRK